MQMRIDYRCEEEMPCTMLSKRLKCPATVTQTPDKCIWSCDLILVVPAMLGVTLDLHYLRLSRVVDHESRQFASTDTTTV